MSLLDTRTTQQVIACNNTTERVRRTTYSHASFNRELANAVAVHVAAGKSVEEAIKAVAKRAKKKGRPAPTPAPVAPSAPEPEADLDADAAAAGEAADFALRARYMLAICRLGNGNFDGLGIEELTDIACLVPRTYQGFAAWAGDRFPQQG